MDRLRWTGDNEAEMVDFLERTGGFYFLPDGSISLNWGLAEARVGDWIAFDPDGDEMVGGAFIVERKE